MSTIDNNPIGPAWEREPDAPTERRKPSKQGTNP
jgi:hypothetical protein